MHVDVRGPRAPGAVADRERVRPRAPPPRDPQPPGAVDDAARRAREDREVGVPEARPQRHPRGAPRRHGHAVDVVRVLEAVEERTDAPRPRAAPDRPVGAAERAAVDPDDVVVGLERVARWRLLCQRGPDRHEAVAGVLVVARRLEVPGGGAQHSGDLVGGELRPGGAHPCRARGDHRRGAVRIEHVFRLSRRDLRDVPDVYSKDDLAKAFSSRGPQSDVRVSATAKEPKTAVRLVTLAMEFTRETLTAASLRSIVEQWGGGARTDLTKMRERIAKLQATLASLDRRIDDMEQLRDRYKGEKDFVVSSSASSPVQVQVTGARNLPPLQQLIGLEAERVETKEILRLAHQESLLLRTTLRFFDQFEARVGDGAAIDLAKEILTYAKPAGAAGENDDARGVELALAAISSQI